MTVRPGLPGFRAVFFDLDGTLYDERGGMLRALDETLGLIAELVVGLDVAAAKRLYPEVGRAIWETADLTVPGPDPRAKTQELRCRVWGLLMERCGCPVSPDLAARLAAIYSEARFRHHRLFPEATEVLDRLDSLKAGNGILRVGLITNGASDLQRDKLAACALAERFDPVLVSGEHAANRRRSQVQSRTGEDLSDPDLPHRGARHFQPPHQVADELGELVDGITHFDQRSRSLVIQPTSPRCDGRRGDLQPLGRPDLRPASRRAKLENGQALDRRVVRPPLGRDHLHPRILDAHLLFQKCDLLPEAAVLGLQADSFIPSVRRAAHCHRQGCLRHADYVENGRSNVMWPQAWQRRMGLARLNRHSASSLRT